MPRNNLDLLSLLQEHGAVVEGHFVMPSGFHSQTYIQTSLLLQHPHLAQKIAQAMSEKFPGRTDVVMALTPSNSVLAQEVARVRGARAIFASRIPVISCVGHEIDFTISDFVADCRAATPSNAAEIAISDISEIQKTLYQLGVRLKGALRSDILRKRMRLVAVKKSACMISPVRVLIDERKRSLSLKKERLDRSLATLIEKKRILLQKRMAILDAVNPENVLKRGYSAVFSGDKLLKSARELEKGDEIFIRMHDGMILADVKRVTIKE